LDGGGQLSLELSYLELECRGSHRVG